MSIEKQNNLNKEIAQKVLGLIDLTSLNSNDSSDSISMLCKNAVTPYGNVPAICIYSQFISDALYNLKDTGIKIATVTNFPHGMSDVELAILETKLAIERGADEIDLVLPYHHIKQGKLIEAAKMVKEVKKTCGNKTLKVIIESGELRTDKLIEIASILSIENGADFIKTSTGKVAINATLEATEVMLNSIKKAGGKCAFKAAGGVRLVSEAKDYLDLTARIMGAEWINSNTFRFGASSLLGDVLNVLSGRESILDKTVY